jgi:MFS family permease
VQQRRALVLVFLPFVSGYYLSYIYRTINALISGQLMTELGINAADLGLLTSAYFLTFALVQLPLGVLLDRYGPRRVQGGLLLIAAFGAALFAAGHSLAALLVGRALIGVGVAAALMAGLKAIVLWFPKERLALVNGWFVMLGALGALTASAPAELMLELMGWRGLFTLLAALTAGSALLIYLLVPEPDGPATNKANAVGLKVIYADPRFWRVAPVSATCIGTAWALQGLWAASWLADVDKLSEPQIVQHLFDMGLALSAGALLFGVGADRLRRRGVRPQTLLGAAAVVFVIAQIGLITDWPLPSQLLWAVIGSVGGATVLSYATLAEYYPKDVAGQANAALNILHIGAACIVQYLIGFVVAQWMSRGGHYPPGAYKAAFTLNLVCQVLALGWFTGRRPWAFFAVVWRDIAVIDAPLQLSLRLWLQGGRRARRAWNVFRRDLVKSATLPQPLASILACNRQTRAKSTDNAFLF